MVGPANIVSRLGSFLVGEETTYGTTSGSMTNGYLIDIPTWETSQTEHEQNDITTLGGDYIPPVKGLASAKFNCSYGLRPHATQYNTIAVPADYWLAQFMQSAFGGHTQYAGQSISAASSSTSFTITSGAGATIGTWCGALVSGTIEPALITNIAGNVLTVFPALSGTPTVAANAFIGSDTFYPTQQATTALTLQVADVQDTSSQFTFNGVRTDTWAISVKRDGIITVTQSFAAPKWTGPSVQGISTAVTTDPTRAHNTFYNGTFLLQSAATSTRVHYATEEIDITFTPGMVHVPDAGGSIEGTVGLMRVPPRLWATAKLKCRYDVTLHENTSGYWYNRTALQFIAIIPVFGTSSGTKRFVIFDIGTCVVVGVPQVSDEGGRKVMTLTLHARLDTRCTTPGSTDVRIAPLRIAVL